MNDAAVFKQSFNRANLYYEIRPKTSSIDYDIIRFIKQNSGKIRNYITLSVLKVEELAELLQVNNMQRRWYHHAGMDATTSCG